MANLYRFLCHGAPLLSLSERRKVLVLVGGLAFFSSLNLALPGQRPEKGWRVDGLRIAGRLRPIFACFMDGLTNTNIDRSMALYPPIQYA